MRIPRPAVIFDMDGVAIDTAFAAYMRTMEIFRVCEKPEVEYSVFIRKFRHPYIQFYREHGIEHSEDELRMLFHQKDPHTDAKMFSDFKPTAEKLISEYDACLGIISSSSQVAVDKICRRLGLREAVGSFVLGGQSNKAEAMERFCKEYGASPVHTFMIGDMPTDMEDALAAGICPVGITRGHNGTEDVLKEFGAAHCIHHLDEIFAILAARGIHPLQAA